MKIAMISSWQEPCGIADYTAALAGELKNLVDLKIVQVKHGQSDPAYFRQLGEACRGADLAHVQHEYVLFGKRWPWSYRWPWLLRSLPIPYVVTVHTWLQPAAGGAGWKKIARAGRDGLQRALGWSGYLEAGQFKNARRVIVHTQAHRDFLVRSGLAQGQVAVMPQGIPAGFPKGRADRARRRWHLKGPVVVMFGFLNPAKGHELALRAWPQMPPGATLVIAGRAFSSRDEAYARHIEMLAQAQSPRVRWTGYLPESDLADLLAAAGVVLFPYAQTTSSYALSLALAAGCAVLTSDLVPFQEIQLQQKCLEVFQTGQAGDLVEKLSGLLNDAKRRQALSRAAQAWAKTHQWKSIARKTHELYQSSLY